jgi:hypothetical protein
MAGRISTYLRNNVLGLVAIFIALGAGAYAAGLPKNSVKSKQIKAGAVKNSDLADNAVTSEKVKDGSLLGADFATGELPVGPVGATGAQGPQGGDGATGPQGPTEGDATDYDDANNITLVSQSTVDAATITTTHAGHLFVSKPVVGFSFGCSTGSLGTLWLTLDGVRVPGGIYNLSTGTVYELSLTGVTKSVIPPGPHAVAYELRCATGTVLSTSNTVTNGASVIVLG